MDSHPSTDQLQSGHEFTLLKKLEFKEIKPFILQIISRRNKLINFYILYQTVALAVLVALIAYHTYRAVTGDTYTKSYFIWLILGLFFSFTVLVVLHELMHALAYYVLGKRQLKYGAEIKKFIFYVHAHLQVVNRNEFIIVALTPFVLVQLICIPLIVYFWHLPVSIFFTVIFLAHALFCAGDFAMMSFVMQHRKQEMYTFDDSKNKTAYFYIKKADTPSGHQP
ncbi:DUF3267 domain-containing protein [Saccharicrinis sp. FJH54]|uniref:DUF3267 domain-containing protein n=1 Tax=Saccharicrinis sp. FJH54 TaxID=3344665 RepID=UPI0035D42DC9